MNPGDKFQLVYCPAVTFKFLKHDKKNKQYMFEMLTGNSTGTFTNKQSDVDTALQFKEWQKIN